MPITVPPPPPTPNVTATFIPPPTTPPTIAPTITPTPGTPDLVINLFEGEEDVVKGGASSVNAEYQLTVSNQGTRRSGDFEVSLRIRPNGEFERVNVANLRPGEAVIVVIDYTFDQTGTFILEARVDSTEVVAEISEANNTAQLVVTVQ